MHVLFFIFLQIQFSKSSFRLYALTFTHPHSFFLPASLELYLDPNDTYMIRYEYMNRENRDRRKTLFIRNRHFLRTRYTLRYPPLTWRSRCSASKVCEWCLSNLYSLYDIRIGDIPYPYYAYRTWIRITIHSWREHICWSKNGWKVPQIYRAPNAKTNTIL